jgi:hypothetical protein
MRCWRGPSTDLAPTVLEPMDFRALCRLDRPAPLFGGTTQTMNDCENNAHNGRPHTELPRWGYESLTLAFCLATRRWMNFGPSFL